MEGDGGLGTGGDVFVLDVVTADCGVKGGQIGNILKLPSPGSG